MLHTEAVPAGALPVLKRLMAIDEMRDYALVGGTALSLRYGHRLSVDLDLFVTTGFDPLRVHKVLLNEFKEDLVHEPDNVNSIGVFCFIAGVKVDIVNYRHPLLKPLVVEDGIRSYSDADIAAMKIQAILGRGRKKDFWDLYELFQHHSLQQISDWHRQKYPDQMLAIGVPNAISYFSDADESEDPVSLKGQTWEGIKRSISQTVSDYLK